MTNVWCLIGLTDILMSVCPSMTFSIIRATIELRSKHQRYLGIKKCSGAKWDIHTKLEVEGFCAPQLILPLNFFFNLNMTSVWCLIGLTNILMSVCPFVTFFNGRAMIEL